MSFLRLEGVGKRYGAVAALDGVDLEIRRGSRTAVIGPSGSGKTTLLRLVGGFQAPDAGRITLDGEVLANGRSFVPAHRRGIGLVPQDGALFPHLSVAANIGFGLERRLADRDRRILALMDSVELDRRMADRRPHQLSGGQQQRVALARALARQPKLMLLDEPFSALDTGLRESMRLSVARILAAAGTTAILVTHDQSEALSFADQVAVLRDGRLMQAGQPRDLYFRPVDRETALFLGEAIILPAVLADGRAECRLGRVAVDADGVGDAQIMLRPEQIRLAPASPDEANAATVVAVSFAGATYGVTLALTDATGETRLSIRASGVDPPPVGSRARIGVEGRAHVLGFTPSPSRAGGRGGTS